MKNNNVENMFKSLIHFNKQNEEVAKEQIQKFIDSDLNKQTIHNYSIIDLTKEFLVVNKNNLLIYKSFETKYMAIDYCLDKINTEGKQMSITSWEE